MDKGFLAYAALGEVFMSAKELSQATNLEEAQEPSEDTVCTTCDGEE